MYFKSTRGEEFYVTKQEFKYCFNTCDNYEYVPLLIRDIQNKIYWCFTGSPEEYKIRSNADDIGRKNVPLPTDEIVNFGIFLWKYF